ncbi:MAG TPA: hypothetical protein VJ598_05955, partial [Albitalea sp.]|nr:hypothetical protein [Albitalea sp.]
DVSAAAEAWLASASVAPCSCRWICEHLGLDYGYVWAHRDDPTAHRVRPNAGSRTTCKEEAA